MKSIDWERVIELAYQLTFIFKHRITPIQENHGANKRDFEHYSALKRLRNRFPDIEYTISLDQAWLSTESIKNISSETEKLIIAFGGSNTIEKMFNHLAENRQFDPIQRRFHIYRESSLTSDNVNPQIPYGFILNMAAKHICDDVAALGFNNDKLWDEITKLSMDLAASLNIQPYYSLDGINLNMENQPYKLRQFTLYDSIFTFEQTPWKDACILLSSFLGCLTDIEKGALEVKLGIHPDDILPLYGNAMQILNNKHKSKRKLEFSFDNLNKTRKANRKLRKTSARNILCFLNRFSHNPDKINNDYCSIGDSENINLYSKPFQRLNEDSYTSIYPSIGSMGIYEEVFSEYRKYFNAKRADRLKGKAFEKAIRKTFSTKGIFTGHGDVWKNRREKISDVDAVIETSNYIYLIECKARTLLPSTKAGSISHAYSDLAWSLMKSQLQLAKIELELHKKGKIDLKNGKKVRSTVKLDGRTVERVTMTMGDYHSLQDKPFSAAIIQEMLGKKINLNKKEDEATERAFKNLNEYIVNLDLCYSELLKYVRDYNSIKCSTWSLSFSQLQIILQDVKNENDFEKNMLLTRATSFGLRNFYMEYSHLKRNPHLVSNPRFIEGMICHPTERVKHFETL